MSDLPGAGELRSQAKTITPTLLAAYLPALFVLAAVALAPRLAGIAVGDLTRDPSNSVHYPFYIGAVSYFGILLWCSAAAICMFSLALLASGAENAEFRAFLLASGLFTVWLLLDDLFLFHEKAFPHYLHIHQNVLYACYAGGLLLYCFAFRSVILKTDFLILLAAGGFLGASMLFDAPMDDAPDTNLKFLIEDGLKFLGIVGWFTYFARVCLLRLRGALSGAARLASQESTS